MNELAQSAALLFAMTCTPAAACDAATTLHEPVRVQMQQDAWLGADKFTHAGVSWAATAFIFTGAHAAGAETEDAVNIAAPAALALGVAKELLDARRSRFSVKDLLADATGVAAAYFFLREVR